MAKSHNRFSRTRKRHPRKEKPICVIATEGEVTERIYFEKIRELVKDEFVIHILPASRKGDSSPKLVVKRLKNFVQRKFGTKRKKDEFWVVIDFDSWGIEQLTEAYRECVENKFKLAVSNPCFELWLNFHQENPKTPNSCSDCEKCLTKLFGKKYDKTDYDAVMLIENVHLAIIKSKQLHKNKKEPFPNKTGTHVYQFVEKLIP